MTTEGQSLCLSVPVQASSRQQLHLFCFYKKKKKKKKAELGWLEGMRTALTNTSTGHSARGRSPPSLLLADLAEMRDEPLVMRTALQFPRAGEGHELGIRGALGRS